MGRKMNNDNKFRQFWINLNPLGKILVIVAPLLIIGFLIFCFFNIITKITNFYLEHIALSVAIIGILIIVIFLIIIYIGKKVAKKD